MGRTFRGANKHKKENWKKKRQDRQKKCGGYTEYEKQDKSKDKRDRNDNTW